MDGAEIRALMEQKFREEYGFSQQELTALENRLCGTENHR